MKAASHYPELIVLPPSTGKARRWPHLLVSFGIHAGGMIYRLITPETIVGRAWDADVGAGISKRHARLTMLDDRVVIEDLGSGVGTLVGGKRLVGRRFLDEGESFSVARDEVMLTYSTILDTALRRSGVDPANAATYARAKAANEFFGVVRFQHMDARDHGEPFTPILFRIDVDGPWGETADEQTAMTQDAMHAVVAIVRESVLGGPRIFGTFYPMARPAEDELVIFVRMRPEHAASFADDIRQHVERSKSIQAMVSGSVTVTAGILPVPVDILAPETILCAVGSGLRAAMAGEHNTVVRLALFSAAFPRNHEDGANGADA